MKMLMIFFTFIALTKANSMIADFQSCSLECRNGNEEELRNPISQHSPNRRLNLIRGKSGPRGLKGDQGSVGLKGERGQDCNSTEMIFIKSQLVHQTDKLRKSQIETNTLKTTVQTLTDQMKTLKTDLNATKTALNAANAKITRMEEPINIVKLKLCGLISKIEDARITASSIHTDNDNWGTQHARLFSTSGNGAWLAHTHQGEWIQVDVGKDEKLHAVATQGTSKHGRWVTSFTVSFKNDTGESFSNIKDQSGETLIFQGNTDMDTVVVNNFPEQVEARYVRIHPLTYHIYPYIRFDVITC